MLRDLIGFIARRVAPRETVSACRKMSPSEIEEKILIFVEGKRWDYIVAFPEYQEGWEGFFYDDVKSNLHHVYYNPTDEIDVAVYDDLEKFIRDVLYLNSISVRNYPIGFHLFSGCLADFREKVERIEAIKRAEGDFGKGGSLLMHREYFLVDEYCLLK